MKEGLVDGITVMASDGDNVARRHKGRLKVFILPVPFFVSKRLCLRSVALSRDRFCRGLKTSSSVSASRPSPKRIVSL